MNEPAIFKGVVANIEYKGINGHYKKIVTLRQSKNNIAFVEFRGYKMDLLDHTGIGTTLNVSYYVEGKISKSSGIYYNNLVAIKIIK